MEEQLISIIVGGLALLGIVAKTLRDELLLRKTRNGHNPNMASLDGKLEGLKGQLYGLTNRLAISHERVNNYHERALEHLEKIRENLEHRN